MLKSLSKNISNIFRNFKFSFNNNNKMPYFDDKIYLTETLKYSRLIKSKTILNILRSC